MRRAEAQELSVAGLSSSSSTAPPAPQTCPLPTYHNPRPGRFIPEKGHTSEKMQHAPERLQLGVLQLTDDRK